MVLKMGGKWLYSCCFMGCYFLDLFNIARSILVQFSPSFFYKRFASVHVVHPFSSIYTNASWKKSHFISSDRPDLHMIDSLTIAVHAFARNILTSLSTDETWLPRDVNLSSNFWGPPFTMQTTPRLKLMYSVLSASTWKSISSCWLFLAMQQEFYLGRCIYNNLW